MKKGVIYRAIKNRTITLFMIVLIAIAGLYNYYIMPRQEVPDISAPVAKITTAYPGASSETVEKLITSKIEDEISSIEGYDYSQSYSRDSISIVTVFLTNDADVDKSWDELRRRMNDIQSDLPEQAQEIQVDTNLVDTAGMILSISGGNYSYEELASYADKIKNELSTIEGVSKFEVKGKLEKELKIVVDQDKLNQYPISIEDISNAIKAQSVEIPAGAISSKESKINVKTSSAYNSIEDMENTIVYASKETGALVRLKDVAKVQMALEDSSYKIKHNGKNSVLLTGYFRENRNIVLIGDEVEAKLNEVKKDLPSDLTVDKVLYQPEDVKSSVNDFVINLIEGMVFVMLVVFIGIGFRNAIVVSTAIPISMLMTFSFMNLFGIKIHQISITALIIALGMLVDNAIVISDAIQVKIDNDEEKLEACIKGAKETAMPVFTSTLTTIAVFTPLLTLAGAAGNFLKSIPQICIISLLASFGVAIFVTPTLAYILFKKSSRKEKDSFIKSFFSKALQLAMKKKIITVVLAIAALGGSLGMIKNLGLEFFPKADKSIIYLNINAENSIDINKTEEIANSVEKILSEQSEILSYTTSIGEPLPKFFFSVAPGVQAIDNAQTMISVDLGKENRFKTNGEFVDYLQQLFDAKISGGKVAVKELENGQPIGSPVRVRVSGNNIDEIIQASNVVKETLIGIDGAVNVNSDVSDKRYEYFVDVENETAINLGLTQYDIQKQINMALKGSKASVYREEGNEYNVIVSSDISSKEELENLSIKSSITGGKILLKQVAEINLLPQNTLIKKYNKNINVMVTSDISEGYSSVKIQNILEEKLASKNLENVKVTFDGEREQITKNFGDMGVVALFAILIIYMIIMVQFGSLIQPLIIMLTIPLSIIGSVLGLFIFKEPLSFTAVFGIVSLAGIVVNNAIILVDYINSERKLGISLDEACREAAGKRFRPVMLTTITTVIGLIPLAFSGSSMFAPMSIALMAGLIVATLLTLIVIPVVFSIVISRVERIIK